MNADAVYLDKTVITNLQQFLSEDKLRSLMSRYIEDSISILEQLDSTLAAGDHEVAHRLAHSLKSTSANVGALPLSELAREIEEIAREGQSDGLDTRLLALHECFEQTRLVIQTLDIMR